MGMPDLADVTIDAVNAAILAPSPHNTQPWRFDTGDGFVDVLLDPDRVLSVVDPGGREARISCGAALFNLRMTLRVHGVAVYVNVLPERQRPDLLARVRFGGRREATAEERTLAASIARRHTNRRPFLERPIPAAVLRDLTRAALLEGTELLVLDDPARYGPVAALLRRAELAQREDPDCQAEKRRWIAEDAGRDDGVPPIAAGPPPAVEPLILLREYGPHGPSKPRPYEQEPPLAVLLTREDTARDHVRAGQVLQRVLLAVTAAGLSASFLSAAVERPAARQELRGLLHPPAHPQVVLRMGYGTPAPPTARRPAAAVTRSGGFPARNPQFR